LLRTCRPGPRGPARAGWRDRAGRTAPSVRGAIRVRVLVSWCPDFSLLFSRKRKK
jgi:hypothetical protein